jgi:outer membrane lipoprotein carrier protein
MKRRLQTRLLVCLLLLTPLTVVADTTPAGITSFFGDLSTLSADFDQQVLDSNNQPIQSSQGHMWIKRPGLFRWDYMKPYEQQIVADGKRLWSYDKDLEQVTVQPLEEVLTATPAMLLGSERPLEEVFTIRKVDAQQVLLTPKNDDSNVIELRLWFSDSELERIAAADSFGNTTVFTFSNIRRNLLLDGELFRFDPPDGADVVGHTP